MDDMIHLNLDKIKKTESPIIDRNTIMRQYGISKSTLQRWVQNEGLQSYKVNRRVFFKVTDLNKWFETYKVVKQSV
tara:strand:- start:67 stop:294 length:228 start_codon:yes stop_codon:yes gene_type:complete